jgi:aryl-alcohol dehydrogenase-like predicted oxidoreductase
MGRSATEVSVIEQRNLGKSGLRVSVVGLGCNNFGNWIDKAASQAVVHKALDLGITLLDTADAYGNKGGSETILGEILGPRRKDVVLATKFGLPMDDAETLKGGSRRYVVTAVEASLKRLKTDWIDLYQLHRPDPLTPIEETLRALDDLVRHGKVRYVGCSNMVAWQVVEAAWSARQLGLNGFIACQDEYSLLVRGIERELVPAMQAHGLGLLPYFPLASGLLTGKYKRNTALPAASRLTTTQRLADRFMTDANWSTVERLEGFCAERSHSPLELAFSWLAGRPLVASIIAGATKPEQLEQNARAIAWTLSQDELAEIDRITLD